MVLKDFIIEELDIQTDYTFTVLSTHRDPLEREIAEAIRIKQAIETRTMIDVKGKTLHVNSLNKKLEHFAPRERWES